MSDILCVTNRLLCKEDYFDRLAKIAKAKPAGIILREKELSEDEYRALAERALQICNKYGTRLVLHTFSYVAAEIGCNALHVPLKLLRNIPASERARYTALGASCHSVSEAVEAESLGCTYIIAGHIFDTDCKRGLPGRGTDFLRSVCRSVSVPVFAIGGICPANICEIRQAGAKGACVMSSVMTCKDVKRYLEELA